MADTWEQVGSAAASGSGGWGTGGYSAQDIASGGGWGPRAAPSATLGSGAGAQQAQNQSWQDAGSSAAGGGQTWQEAGSGAAAGGETLGSGSGSNTGGFGPGTYNLGGWYGSAGFDAYYNNGRAAIDQINTVAAARAALGGSSFGGSSAGGSAAPSPSPINNPSSGSGGGSGGGGGGGGSGNVQQQQQPQQPRPPTTSGTGSSGGGGSGLLSSILGNLSANQYEAVRKSVIDTPQLGSQNYQQFQPLQGLGSDTSSFGGLLSNNNQNQQQQQSYQQPQSINQAVEDSFNAFSGNGRAAPGSAFSGGIGGASANSGSAGSSFEGGVKSPFQAMASQGPQALQYQQPTYGTGPYSSAGSPAHQADGTYASPQNAGLSAIRQQGVPQGPGMSSVPFQNPKGTVGPNGTPVNFKGNPTAATGGIAGGVSGDENVPSLNPPKQTPMQEIVNLDAPNIKMNVGGQEPAKAQQPAPAKAPMKIVNLDAPGITMDLGGPAQQPDEGPSEAARGAISNPEGSPVQGPYRFPDDAIKGAVDFSKQYLMKPAAQGATKTLVNQVDAVAQMTGNGPDQKTREGVQSLLKADEAKIDAENKAHPWISKGAQVVGELVPYIAEAYATRRAGLGIPGTGTMARVAKGTVFNSLIGGSQYAPTMVDRAVNTGMGALLGVVGSAAAPLVSNAYKKVVSSISSVGTSPAGTLTGAYGAYEGYNRGNGFLDTIAKMAIGATSGYVAGKTGGGVANWVARKATGESVAKAAPVVASKAATTADDFVPTFGRGQTEAAQAAHLKSIIQDKAIPVPKQVPPGMFDSAAERQMAQRAMLKDYIPPEVPTPKFTPPAAPVAADTRGMLRKGVDGTLSAAAAVGSQEIPQAITKQPAPQPSENKIVPPAAPESPYAEHNKAMMAKLTPQQDVQKFVAAPDPQKPMAAQLQPGAQQAILKTMPGEKQQAIALDIMRANHKDFIKSVNTEKGRKDIYKAIEKSAGPKGVAELDEMFKELDGLTGYRGPDIKDVKTPLQAVAAKLDQAKYVKAKEEAEKAAKSDSKGQIKQTVQQLQQEAQQAPAGAVGVQSYPGRTGKMRGGVMKGSINQRINAARARLQVKILGLMSSLGQGPNSPFHLGSTRSKAPVTRSMAPSYNQRLIEGIQKGYA